ncbi:MAG: adenylate/guanylate cyclase domain-containing protein [Desulfococcaceae bacterium]
MTILFTDLVGSAAVKTEKGIHKAQTLELVHKRILLEVLDQIRVLYQDNAAQPVRVEGDSYIFVFSNPSHAIHFALLAQEKHREARAGQWPELPEFRIGIDLGEVIVEQGLKGPNMPGGIGDIKGLQADMTARIMGLAQGGQILCSSSAFDSAKQALTGINLDGINGKTVWQRHGPYLLKGRDTPLEICEVGAENFAPLKKPEGSEKAKPLGSQKKISSTRIWIVPLGVLLISVFAFLHMQKGEQSESSAHSDTASFAISPAEAAVDEIKYKIIKLHSAFESIDDYGDYAAREVREKAPRFAQQILNIDESGMDLKHRILKYQFATFSFSMAAWVESDLKERKDYANQAISAGHKTIELIEEAESKASRGTKEDQVLADWIVSNHRKEGIHYFLAVSFAIKARDGDESAIREVSRHTDAIPASYKERYPLEKEPNLKWFLDNRKGKNDG